jgi:hypothetical protein
VSPAKKKHDVLILGDSVSKGLTRINEYKSDNITIKSTSGETVQDLKKKIEDDRSHKKMNRRS